MKKHASILLLLSLLLALPAAAQTASKICTIDLQKVFTEYYKTKEADGRLKEILGNFQKDYQEMLSDYQKSVDEATKLRDDVNNATLSKEMRDEKSKALQIKVQDVKNMERKLQEFDVTRRKQLDDQSSRMRKSIVEEITKVINDLGARESYNLIFDRSGVTMNGTSTVLYASGLKDITDDIIKVMNSSKPAGGPVTSAAPASTAPITSKPAGVPVTGAAPASIAPATTPAAKPKP
jgi:outer membrane protein